MPERTLNTDKNEKFQNAVVVVVVVVVVSVTGLATRFDSFLLSYLTAQRESSIHPFVIR